MNYKYLYMKLVFSFFVFITIVNLYNAQGLIDEMGGRNMKIVENQRGIYVLNANTQTTKKDQTCLVTGQLYDQDLNKIDSFSVSSKFEYLLPFVVYNKLSNNKTVDEIIKEEANKSANIDKKNWDKWGVLVQDKNKYFTIIYDKNLQTELSGLNLQISLFNNNNLYTFNSVYNDIAPVFMRSDRRFDEAGSELGFSCLSPNTSVSKIDLTSLPINSDDMSEMYRLKKIIWKTNLNLTSDAFYKVLGVNNGIVCCLVKTNVKHTQ